MIESLYQIDFITTSGTLRLLDVGDMIEADIAIRITQEATSYAPIGAKWGEPVAAGGAMVAVDWAVVKNHASHAALRGYCFSHAAAMPYGETGTLRLTISGGGVWEIADGTLVSCAPMALLPSHAFETLTAYSFSGGAVTEGMTTHQQWWPNYAQEWEILTGNWATL